MQKAQKRKRLYLVFALVGLFFAFALTGASVLLVYKFQYVPAIVLAVLSAVGYYGVPFFFFAHLDMRLVIKIAEFIAGNGNAQTPEIAASLGLKEKAVGKIYKKALKRGYIS